MSFADDWKAKGKHRLAVITENPEVMDVILGGGQFGGDYSVAIANRMYSRTNGPALTDASDNVVVEQHAPGVHLIRLPIVNIAAFETGDGLVLVDAGYAPAGHALVAAVESITSLPVHTIILTHFHCDHAFGAWALFEAGHAPDLVATAAFETELQADIDTWGLNVRFNNQHPDDVPQGWERAFTPTITFHDQMILTVGGIEFHLTHHRGETEDQLWVWVPEHATIVSADYYQPFLPNAGNGKRRQRHVAEWSTALRSMADCAPQLVLPMHGPAITDPAEAQDRLRAHADILASIDRQVRDGLNAGIRGDVVVESVTMPAEHADRDDIEEVYSTVRDIARMAAGQYTGWWDEIPAHWRAPRYETLSAEVATLAGGADALIRRAEELLDDDLRLACELGDMAHYAAPDDEVIGRRVIAVWVERIARERTPTQEALVYLDHLADLRSGLSEPTS